MVLICSIHMYIPNWTPHRSVRARSSYNVPQTLLSNFAMWYDWLFFTDVYPCGCEGGVLYCGAGYAVFVVIYCWVENLKRLGNEGNRK